MNINEMLQLPIYLQVSLGSGFLAYVIAYHGKRKNEKAVDLLFGVIAFSLPGILLWLSLEKIEYATAQSIFLVVTLTVGLGLLWRKWGQRLWYHLMHKSRISNDEGYAKTLPRLIQDPTIKPTQLFVTLKNGKILGCTSIDAFRQSPVSGWSIDDEGNIAMYVCEVDGKSVIDETINDWGQLVTYIPKEEVHCMDIRFTKTRSTF